MLSDEAKRRVTQQCTLGTFVRRSLSFARSAESSTTRRAWTPTRRRAPSIAAFRTATDLPEQGGLSGEAFDNLYTHYREVYKKVSEEDVQAYERQFRGSEAEAAELRELYTRFAGDMEKVFSWLCCSRPELDSHRFMETLQQAIDAGGPREHGTR